MENSVHKNLGISDEPILSICMICYNQADYIAQAIDGVLKQTCEFRTLLIIGEDCSTDATRSVCEKYAAKYPDQIRLLPSSKNLGAMENFVRTLAQARGKYVALCEGDDYWVDPLKLQKQVAWLEAHPECGLVYSQVRWFWQRTGKFGKIRGGSGNRETTFDVLLEENRVPTPTAVIRKELLDRYLDEVRPQDRNWMMGDYPMWLYIAAHVEVRFIPEPMAVYRVLPCSASHFDGYEKAIRFHESAYEIRRYFAERYAPQQLDRIAIFEQWDRMSIAVHYRRIEEAFRIYIALKANGVHPENRYQRRSRRRTLRLAWIHPFIWFRKGRNC